MSHDTRPWYREPMVWLIIALPATAVVVGLTMYYIAYQTRDGLVVDDYYQKGKEINKSLQRDRRAADLGLNGRLVLDAATQTVQVKLTSAKGTLPATLGLRWLHATRAGFDRSQELVQAGNGLYRAALPKLAPGHWYVQVEAQDWRLQGSLHAPGEMQLELKPVRTLGVPAG